VRKIEGDDDMMMMMMMAMFLDGNSFRENRNRV
jgi:hypothetical protein